MKGVSWSPVPLGQGPASSNQFSTAVVQDAQLMSVAGINVVRTYRPILDETVLDELWSQGIYVMMTVFYGFGDTIDTALQNVCAVKDHPAVLGWIVGNEWNYTNLEQPISLSRAVTRVGQLIDAIKLNDPTRPASTVYGYLPPRAVLARLQNVDIWGSNVYTGPSFGSFFSQWEALSDKPIYLAEYGADAYDGTRGQVDETTQANILAGLTGEINNNASVNGQGPCAGGFAFEFNDEWWKFARGSWSQHDTTASWQSFGYPDPNMHEEWWGMVDIFRTPREAYFAYRDITAPVANSP